MSVARLPRPEKSSAVLIGVSEFKDPNLQGLPAVKRNLDDLEAAITDPSFGGFTAGRCQVVREPRNLSDLKAVVRLADEAKDTFLVYYAGHGVLGRRGDLYLALGETEYGAGDKRLLGYGGAYPVQLLKETLVHCKAKLRVLILDCCFSGRALDGMQADPQGFLDETDTLDIDGTFTLASSAPNQVSIAPIGAAHTAFTGDLLSQNGSSLSSGSVSAAGCWRRPRRRQGRALRVPAASLDVGCGRRGLGQLPKRPTGHVDRQCGFRLPAWSVDSLRFVE
jgi:uncharacterized caspase-like protein